MCKLLEVSETGYYRYVRRLGRPDKDTTLSAEIEKILKQSEFNDNYGVKRIQLALMQNGIKAGVRRITRVMRQNGWLHKPHRKPKSLTKATTEIQEKENLLKQDFHADKPLTKLLTDITQIQCKDGKLYISPIMDCYNGEIVALSMNNNMKTELCVTAFRNLMQQYRLFNCTLHSDRGSQYTSDAFRYELSKAGVTQSLSGVNHCYDNARMESFFATLKKELLYRLPVYKMSMEEVKRIVFRYIFTYYNRVRIYTSNPEGLPPTAYRQLYYSNCSKAA